LYPVQELFQYVDGGLDAMIIETDGGSDTVSAPVVFSALSTHAAALM